jgi:hypothetical protein
MACCAAASSKRSRSRWGLTGSRSPGRWTAS